MNAAQEESCSILIISRGGVALHATPHHPPPTPTRKAEAGLGARDVQGKAPSAPRGLWPAPPEAAPASAEQGACRARGSWRRGALRVNLCARVGVPSKLWARPTSPCNVYAHILP